MELARARGVRVIEDCAQAFGATCDGQSVGTIGDIGCFSLQQGKHITTGEGGVVTANDDELATRLRRFRSHGIEQRPDEGGWYYSAVDVGYNYRLTDLQAALGRSQMNKIDAFIARRRARSAAASPQHHTKLFLTFFDQLVDFGNLRRLIRRAFAIAAVAPIAAAPRAAVVTRHKYYPFAHRVVAFTLIG